MGISADKELLDLILSTNEWQTFDCKRALIKPAKLLEAVIAFANTAGGIIALGVEDPLKAEEKNSLFGFKKNENIFSDFIKLENKNIAPPLKLFRTLEIAVVHTKKQPDKILIISVGKSDEVHSLRNGDTFVRRGDQCVKIGSQEIIRIKYEKGAIKFEDESANECSFDDLDQELVNKFKKDVSGERTETCQLFKDNGLAIKRDSAFKLTKGGVLLFAKNPSVLLKGKFGIKISHYYGNKANYSGDPNFVRRPFTIEGSLIKQIEKAMEYFKEIIYSAPPKLKNSAFKTTFKIPEWAFQEAVTNAVIHRNYSVSDDIQIRFFDNRIEIESPGGFPGHISIHNILTERCSRNPIILRTINRFSDAPNLDIGEGVNRMFRVMEDENLYSPVYFPTSLKPNTVFLILYNIEKVEAWDIVNKYLESNYRITNKIARQITDVPDTLKMTRVLKKWVEEGLLQKVGTNAKKVVYYIKPGRDIPLDLFSKRSENKIKTHE